MKIASILTSRFFEKSPNFHLIYEWEDDMSQDLGVPIRDGKPIYRKALINRFSKKLITLLGKNALGKLNNSIESWNGCLKGKFDYNLVYELYVNSEPGFATSSRAIPIMIDFWKHTDLDSFYKTYRNCKLVLISSLEAYNFLKEQGCPLNIAHFPLGLSDRYRLFPEIRYPKKYDILLAGRQDDKTMFYLENYLKEFINKYPDVEIVHRKSIEEGFCYESSKKGVIGKFHTRQAYIDLLRSSKISFYSTPGVDGGEQRTGGFNPVTPRYLELLSAQCLLLGRYPENEETSYYELEKVCPNITSYDHFEQVLLGYLNAPEPSFDRHREILNKHYTSCRAKQLTEILKEQVSR
jgi:hypothetical protein